MTDLPLPRRRGVPWLFVGLAASLALNAFFIGAIATDVFRFSAAEKRHVNFELRWLEERLAPEDFAIVAAAVGAARPDAERHFTRLRSLRQELGILAAAPDPDRTAIDAKLVEIRAEQSAMVAGLQATVVDSLLGLSGPARAALVEDPATGGD
jgi:uncharacterized membrane protein